MSSTKPSTTAQQSRSEALFPFSPYDSVSASSFSPDSSFAYIASWDSTLSIYQISPQTDPKRALHAPKLNFQACIQTPSPITSMVSVSTQQLVVGLVSGQILLFDLSMPSQPKLSPFFTTSSPIVSLKYNQHHDLIVVLDFSTSLFAFHRLQLQSNVLQKPLFSQITPLLSQQLHTNYLFSRFLTNDENLSKIDSDPPSSSPSPTSPKSSSQDVLAPTEVSPRYPITMDTYHDFCIIALPHSCDVYLISSSHSPDVPDPSTIDPRNALKHTQSYTENQTASTQTQTQTQTQTASAQLRSAFLRATTVNITKYRSYHSPFIPQISTLTILPHTLQIAPDSSSSSNPPTTRRIGYALGCLEGRAAIDYISVCNSSTELKQLTQQDEKKRFAFKCHRLAVESDSSNNSTTQTTPTSTQPTQILYSVNQIAYHSQSQTFATCGGDGAIVVWSESQKKKVSGFGGKLLPIDTVAFSPDGKYVLWSESPVYTCMMNASLTFNRKLQSPSQHQSPQLTKSKLSTTNTKRNGHTSSELGYANVQNFHQDNLPTTMDSVHGFSLYEYISNLSDGEKTSIYSTFNMNSALLAQELSKHPNAEISNISPPVLETLSQALPEQTEYLERQVLTNFQESIKQELVNNKTDRFRLFIRVVTDPMVFFKKA